MTVKYVQKGEAIDYTPSSAVSAGDVVVQGDLVGVAKLDIKADALGALAVSGVFDISKATGAGTAIAVGALVHYDEAAKVVTENDASGANKLIGITVKAASDDDATARVLLIQGERAIAQAEATETGTDTAESTPSDTETGTDTDTAEATPSATGSDTDTETAEATPSDTASATQTPTDTDTETDTDTAEATPSATDTDTDTGEATPSATESATETPLDQYTVSGAGSSEVNGTYARNGDNNGKPRYTYNTNYDLIYASIGSKWVITYGNDQDWMHAYYYTDDAGETPPSTGWTASNGTPPAPTVTQG